MINNTPPEVLIRGQKMSGVNKYLQEFVDEQKKLGAPLPPSYAKL